MISPQTEAGQRPRRQRTEMLFAVKVREGVTTANLLVLAAKKEALPGALADTSWKGARIISSQPLGRFQPIAELESKRVAGSAWSPIRKAS